MADKEPDRTAVFTYEVKMFFGTHSRCQQGGYDQIVNNALMESFLLHTRILVDILLEDRANRRRDDITLSMLLGRLWPQELDRLICKLKNEYGDKNVEGTPCFILNKMLAHATTYRVEQKDYQSVIVRIGPTIQEILCLPEVQLIHGETCPEAGRLREPMVVIGTSTPSSIETQGMDDDFGLYPFRALPNVKPK